MNLKISPYFPDHLEKVKKSIESYKEFGKWLVFDRDSKEKNLSHRVLHGLFKIPADIAGRILSVTDALFSSRTNQSADRSGREFLRELDNVGGLEALSTHDEVAILKFFQAVQEENFLVNNPGAIPPQIIRTGAAEDWSCADYSNQGLHTPGVNSDRYVVMDKTKMDKLRTPLMAALADGISGSGAAAENFAGHFIARRLIEKLTIAGSSLKQLPIRIELNKQILELENMNFFDKKLSDLIEPSRKTIKKLAAQLSKAKLLAGQDPSLIDLYLLAQGLRLNDEHGKLENIQFGLVCERDELLERFNTDDGINWDEVCNAAKEFFKAIERPEDLFACFYAQDMFGDIDLINLDASKKHPLVATMIVLNEINEDLAQEFSRRFQMLGQKLHSGAALALALDLGDSIAFVNLGDSSCFAFNEGGIIKDSVNKHHSSGKAIYSFIGMNSDGKVARSTRDPERKPGTEYYEVGEFIEPTPVSVRIVKKEEIKGFALLGDGMTHPVPSRVQEILTDKDTSLLPEFSKAIAKELKTKDVFSASRLIAQLLKYTRLREFKCAEEKYFPDDKTAIVAIKN